MASYEEKMAWEQRIHDLEMHVRHLENILLDMTSHAKNGGWPIPGICLNASLHSKPFYDETHLLSLSVPHYEWSPQIDWSVYPIHLHPGNSRD